MNMYPPARGRLLATLRANPSFASSLHKLPPADRRDLGECMAGLITSCYPRRLPDYVTTIGADGNEMLHSLSGHLNFVEMLTFDGLRFTAPAAPAPAGPENSAVLFAGLVTEVQYVTDIAQAARAAGFKVSHLFALAATDPGLAFSLPTQHGVSFMPLFAYNEIIDKQPLAA